MTLGDYVDRGPDSRGVIEFLLGLRKRCHLVALRGNHEIMMLHARDDRSLLLDWIACGGDATLDSYGTTGFQDVPESQWDVLAGTLRYHETAHDFFVHANVHPDQPLKDQPDYNLFWEHLGGAVARHVSGRRMICGHTPQASGLPLDLGHAVCLDTHACGGGWLYTGIATDVERRFGEHVSQGPKAAKYLRGRLPLEIVYRKELGSRSVASKEDLRIKRMEVKRKVGLVNGG